MDKKFSALFEPFTINEMGLKNRLFMPAMGIPTVTENGAYTKEAIAFYAARSKGGVGLIITGANEVKNIGEIKTVCTNPGAMV
jgi:NADH:flavin oxidoreductases, Old Yellow Enzyme family